jgi:1,2-diacylglycerol 3-alpha-glucosyltransferase
MRILLLNSILYTPRTTPKGRFIPQVASIEDCMIIKLGIEFVNQGHEVTLIAAEEYKPTYQQDFPIEIVYFRSMLPKLFLPTVLPFHPQLIHFIRKHKGQFDMIISSEIFSFNSLFAACLVPDKTLIWQESGNHNRKFFRLPSLIWYHLVARAFMRKVRVIPRSLIAGKFAKQFGLNVFSNFIDHGVDGKVFHFQKEKKASFIVIAHLDRDKDVISIIISYKKFIERYSDRQYSLYIIGEGEESENLKDYVQSNQLSNQVFFLGRIPQRELSKYLSESVCLLCNSRKELNMLSIGEAIVAGTPVLTNTVPYSHEWITQNKLGIAKDNWTEEDMYEIVMNNRYYVDNCSRYSSQLLLSELPNKFIKQFNIK